MAGKELSVEYIQSRRLTRGPKRYLRARKKARDNVMVAKLETLSRREKKIPILYHEIPTPRLSKAEPNQLIVPT